MIRFERLQDPDWDKWFQENVRAPGLRWLAEHPKGRPKDYWNKPEVQERVWTSFRRLCAYTAMHIGTSGEIDHFVSCDEDRSRAYDWDNYRYADPKFNRSKSALRASALLDPFEVEDGWFEIRIEADFQLVMTSQCPEPFRERARTMLKRLRLQNHPRLIAMRREWHRMYESGKLNLSGLEEMAPLVARAIRKQMESAAPPAVEADEKAAPSQPAK